MAILAFQKPDKVIMLEGTDTLGRFEFRPLEPGYAQTIGNALRRILLSSLEGFAISSIKISGVPEDRLFFFSRSSRTIGLAISHLISSWCETTCDDLPPVREPSFSCALARVTAHACMTKFLRFPLPSVKSTRFFMTSLRSAPNP